MKTFLKTIMFLNCRVILLLGVVVTTVTIAQAEPQVYLRPQPALERKMAAGWIYQTSAESKSRKKPPGDSKDQSSGKKESKKRIRLPQVDFGEAEKGRIKRAPSEYIDDAKRDMQAESYVDAIAGCRFAVEQAFMLDEGQRMENEVKEIIQTCEAKIQEGIREVFARHSSFIEEEVIVEDNVASMTDLLRKYLTQMSNAITSYILGTQHGRVDRKDFLQKKEILEKFHARLIELLEIENERLHFLSTFILNSQQIKDIRTALETVITNFSKDYERFPYHSDRAISSSVLRPRPVNES